LSRAQHPCHRRGLFEGSTHERGRTSRNVVCAHPSRRNDRANARSAIGKRDQPKPAKSAAFAKHDNLDVPFPLARIAPCPSDLRVKRGPIEARDPIHGGARPGDDGFASGRIDYESPQKGVNAAVGSARFDSDGASALAHNARCLPPFPQVGSLCASVAEQKVVELVARHLECVVVARLKGLGK
jgi:hypothetical protein